MTCGAENLLTSCGRIACRRHEEAERSGTPPDLHSRPQASLLAAAENSPLSPLVARRQRSGTPPVRPRSHSPTKRIRRAEPAAAGGEPCEQADYDRTTNVPKGPKSTWGDEVGPRVPPTAPWRHVCPARRAVRHTLPPPRLGPEAPKRPSGTAGAGPSNPADKRASAKRFVGARVRLG